MRNRALGLGLVGAAIVFSAGAAHAAGGGIAWSPSFDAAVKSAKRSHKLIMADFYADW